MVELKIHNINNDYFLINVKNNFKTTLKITSFVCNYFEIDYKSKKISFYSNFITNNTKIDMGLVNVGSLYFDKIEID